jgi:hypothetical protein
MLADTRSRGPAHAWQSPGETDRKPSKCDPDGHKDCCRPDVVHRETQLGRLPCVTLKVNSEPLRWARSAIASAGQAGAEPG